MADTVIGPFESEVRGVPVLGGRPVWTFHAFIGETGISFRYTYTGYTRLALLWFCFQLAFFVLIMISMSVTRPEDYSMTAQAGELSLVWLDCPIVRSDHAYLSLERILLGISDLARSILSIYLYCV